jgi:2-methylcitrate dehydratase
VEGTSISRQIARYVHALRYESLPPEVVECTKRFIYDSIGCAFGGYGTEDVRVMLEVITDQGGNPEATVIGSGARTSATFAALANALMIRALDFNDIYWKQDPSHPSDIMPAAFAVAERARRGGKDLIAAIVAAYEIEMRLCEVARPGIRERKWHHATLTQLVSPLVAGMLLGLDEDRLVDAVGISACHNFTPGVVTAGKLTMMKNTVDPMATQAGVFAALLAEKGYHGPEAIYEGKEGFFQALGPEWDLEKLTGGLGRTHKILECSMKAFPTEALTHSHITAALKVVTDHAIKPDEVRSVTVTTIARAVDILFDPEKYRPTTRETADHSLPYCIAAAIVDRRITTDQFSESRIQDPVIRAVLPKIRGEASLEFERDFPAKQRSRVTIETVDGRTFSAGVDYPKGDPREPMTNDDLRQKFDALAEPFLTSHRRERMREAVWSLERFETAADFMGLLVADRDHRGAGR